MTLSELILYPLTHRVVTEASLAATAHILAEYRKHASQGEPAPVKAPRRTGRKAR